VSEKQMGFNKKTIELDGEEWEIVSGPDEFYIARPGDRVIAVRPVPKPLIECWVIATREGTLQGPYVHHDDAKDSARKFGGQLMLMREVRDGD